ncbi:MAG: pseudaminic acid cytidylyltransferase [Clostridiaceae bacterium]|jgi:N-acylneuraminate cytidylyltransferase|nr:pseudaminic acid cytidylyltransferase [Clostridiaceae bacterium]
MKNIAIIPARGGSKRIPRKNIKNFLGKPIIAYSIESAIQSKLFDEIMVSTDDEEIAEVAKKYGASVPFMRSKENADDFASTMDVLHEVVTSYKKELNKEFDYVCCIYATAPLIQVEQLKKGLELLLKEHLASVYPIVPFSYPIWRGVKINELGHTEMIWKEFINSRSQDLEKVFHDAGQWYWYNPLRVTNSLITTETSSIILSEEEVQDIDTEIDWKLAEMKYELLQNFK